MNLTSYAGDNAGLYLSRQAGNLGTVVMKGQASVKRGMAETMAQPS